MHGLPLDEGGGWFRRVCARLLVLRRSSPSCIRVDPGRKACWLAGLPGPRSCFLHRQQGDTITQSQHIQILHDKDKNQEPLWVSQQERPLINDPSLFSFCLLLADWRGTKKLQGNQLFGGLSHRGHAPPPPPRDCKATSERPVQQVLQAPRVPPQFDAKGRQQRGARESHHCQQE